MNYDFCGWATKNNLKCSDGRVIRKNAFEVNDGTKVPLVWNHQHSDPSLVLGHALLKNKDEGVYAYCKFNKSRKAQDAKEAVENGDVVSLSICANNLQQDGCDVTHGVIREVSLVLAGSNPGAYVESTINHGEPFEDYEPSAVIYTGETIIHAADPEPDQTKDDKTEGNDNETETVGDVLDTLTDKQKSAVGILLAEIEDEKNDNNEEEDEEMKHNLFLGKQGDGDDKTTHVLTRDDAKTIFADAKKLGSLRESIKHHMEEGVLLHATIPTTGFDVPSTTPAPTYGINGIDMLFPDYKSLNPTPEFISRRMEWVDKVIGSVHRTPFSRVKSIFANITEDEARAKGYIKGKLKKEEVFSILKRVTDPKTVYKKQKLDRDDILDIGDNMNVVLWLRAEMLMMLREEIARAILIGDGRLASSDDKISEEHIRPIVTEHDLLSIKVPVTVPSNATDDEIAEATIKAMIRARKQYKGTGNPNWYTSDDVITDMLLLENAIGDRKYKTEAELSTAVRVNEIIPVEPMDGQTVSVNGTNYPLLGIVTNLSDYNIGTNKGGEINWFEDFDIDYNQMIYLVETRMSGALIKPFSALVFYLVRESGSGA